MSFAIAGLYFKSKSRNKTLMLDAYVTLEFSKIQSQINEFCKTERGRELVSTLTMSNDKEVIIHSLKELDEMMSLVSRFGPLPISSSVHLLKLIELAKKTAILTPSDLNHILNDIDTSDKVIAHFKKVGVGFDKYEHRNVNFFRANIEAVKFIYNLSKNTLIGFIFFLLYSKSLN